MLSSWPGKYPTRGSFDMSLLSNLGKVPGGWWLKTRVSVGKHHLLLRDQSNGTENGDMKRSTLIILNGHYYNNTMF